MFGAIYPEPSGHVCMETEGKVLVDYIWVGAAGALRSKTKVLDSKPESVEDVPIMVVEAEQGLAAAGLEGTSAMEVFLRPRKIFRDPFRGGDSLLVLCDTFNPPQVDLERPSAQPVPPLQPHPTNMRVPFESVLKRVESEAPAFAVEQEYSVDSDPQGGLAEQDSGCAWPHAHLPDPSQPHLYGPLGAATQTLPALRTASAARAAMAARKLSEAHLEHCLRAGVKISGCAQGSSGGTGTAGVYSYKLGPCLGVDIGDQLWMSRHVLIRLAELMGIPVSFDPHVRGKPGGMGCHFKYSTAASRQQGSGLSVIQQHMGLLQATHVQHMMAYGRSSVRFKSSSYMEQQQLQQPTQFSGAAAAPFWEAATVAIGGTAAALVVPTCTALKRGGHYTDRRPASNVDPWAVGMMLVCTTLGVPMPCSISFPAVAPLSCGAACPPVIPGVPLAAAQGMCMPIIAAAAVAAAGAYAVPYNMPAGSPHCSGVSGNSMCGGGSVFSWGEEEEGEDNDDQGFMSRCTSSATLNTEDVLFQELDRIDGFAPDTPPKSIYNPELESCADSRGDCRSDASSPETGNGCCDGATSSKHNSMQHGSLHGSHHTTHFGSNSVIMAM